MAGRIAALGSTSTWVGLLSRSSRWSGGSGSSASSHGNRAALFAAAGAVGVAAFAPPSSPSQCYFEERSDGSVDRLTRWTKSWTIPNNKDPSFHLPAPNPLLERNLPRLLGPAASKENEANRGAVLVPLCGKTWDMAFFCEQGISVVGVEGITRAIAEFRQEQLRHLKGFQRRMVVSLGADGWVDGQSFDPAPEYQGARPGFVFKTGDQGLGYYSDFPAVWRGNGRCGKGWKPLHIIQSDMFEVTPEMVAGVTFVKDAQFDYVYDRGSLVAIPPEARKLYVSVLSRLLKPEGRMLMIILDYDQSKVPIDPTGKRRTPPPFSVSEADLHELFPERDWQIEVLEEQDPQDLRKTNPNFRGVAVRERVVLVSKRGGVGSTGGSVLQAVPWYYVCGAAVTVAGIGAACLMGKS